VPPRRGDGIQLAEPGAMKAAMARRRASFRDLAHLTGYCSPYLCRVSTGERTPSRLAALEISKALQVPWGQLWKDQ